MRSAAWRELAGTTRELDMACLEMTMSLLLRGIGIILIEFGKYSGSR